MLSSLSMKHLNLELFRSIWYVIVTRLSLLYSEVGRHYSKVIKNLLLLLPSPTYLPTPTYTYLPTSTYTYLPTPTYLHLPIYTNSLSTKKWNDNQIKRIYPQRRLWMTGKHWVQLFCLPMGSNTNHLRIDLKLYRFDRGLLTNILFIVSPVWPD